MTLKYIIPAALLLASIVCAEEPAKSDAHATLKTLKNASSKVILIAAHRGGYENDKADKAPENSIANIRNCQIKGFELYETDIQRTMDGHFVIVHDGTIDRETNGNGKIDAIDLADLKKLKKKYRNKSVSDERVATLGEFLEKGKGHTIFKADLKPGTSDHFKEIMQLVVKHDAMDGIIFRVPYSKADQFSQYRVDGVPYARSLLMFKVSNKEQVDDIKARFDPLTIQVDLIKSDPTNSETLELIKYAASRGLLVETHADGGPKDWAKLADAGVRMFHARYPSKVRAFLKKRDR